MSELDSSIKNCPLIILAAGKSERMGFPKGLYEVKGKSLLEHQIESFKRAGGETILFVVGDDKNTYLEKVKGLESQVTIIKNDKYELGPFYSFQLAVRTFIDSPGYFVIPIDVMPPLFNLYGELLKHQEQVVIPTFEEKGGHPILIRNEFATKLLFYKEGRLDHLIKSTNQKDVKKVEVDEPNILSNYNSKE